MPEERERKFLVQSQAWREKVKDGDRYRQASSLSARIVAGLIPLDDPPVPHASFYETIVAIILPPGRLIKGGGMLSVGFGFSLRGGRVLGIAA